MYELIILSRLIRRPMHGYLIAKVVNNIIGPYAKISNGRFYPLLAKMEKDGFIEVLADPSGHPDGDRNLRQYAITESGKQRHHTLMMDTTSSPGEYSKIFLHKVFTFDLLHPDEVNYLVEHYINYCNAHIFHLKAAHYEIERTCVENGLKQIEINNILAAKQHLMRQWQLELEWVEKLKTEQVAETQKVN